MKIYKLGEDVLRKKCEPVAQITPEMKDIFNEMFDTMNEAEGVGLAAPQVGISQRFFVAVADDEVRRVEFGSESTARNALESLVLSYKRNFELAL